MQQAIGSGLVRTAFLRAPRRDARRAPDASTKASQAVDEGFAHAERTLEGGYLAELHRMRGELLAPAGDARRRRRQPAPRDRPRRSSSRRSPSSCGPPPAWRSCCWPRGRRERGARRPRTGLRLVHRGAHHERPRRRPRHTCRDRTRDDSRHALAPGRTSARGRVRVPARRTRSNRRAPEAAAARRGAQRATRRRSHSALCLSGGGVRSGSFGLGVLQGLARAGLLGKFDYLSTVSRRRLHRRLAHRVALPRAHARGEADPSEQLGRRGRTRAGDAAAPGHQVPRPADRDALRRRLDARRHDVPQPARQLDGADSAHRRGGDAAADLPRTPRPAVAARARQPRDARLVVPPRLDPDRHPDCDRHHLCRGAAAEPRPSLRRPAELPDLVPGAGARRALPVVGAPLLGLAVRRRDLARHRAPDVGGRDGAALDRRRSVQQPLLAAVDLDGRRHEPASSAA